MFSGISSQQLQVHIDHTMELNDTFNRHKIIWVSHYSDRHCTIKTIDSTAKDDQTREIIAMFREGVQLKFRGIKYWLMGNDLEMAFVVLQDTDDFLDDGEVYSLRQETLKLVTMQAANSKILLSEIFKKEIFQLFFAAEEFEKNLDTLTISRVIANKIWNLIRFLQLIDHVCITNADHYIGHTHWDARVRSQDRYTTIVQTVLDCMVLAHIIRPTTPVAENLIFSFDTKKVTNNNKKHTITFKVATVQYKKFVQEMRKHETDISAIWSIVFKSRSKYDTFNKVFKGRRVSEGKDLKFMFGILGNRLLFTILGIPIAVTLKESRPIDCVIDISEMQRLICYAYGVFPSFMKDVQHKSLVCDFFEHNFRLSLQDTFVAQHMIAMIKKEKELTREEEHALSLQILPDLPPIPGGI